MNTGIRVCTQNGTARLAGWTLTSFPSVFVLGFLRKKREERSTKVFRTPGPGHREAKADSEAEEVLLLQTFGLVLHRIDISC